MEICENRKVYNEISKILAKNKLSSLLLVVLSFMAVVECFEPEKEVKFIWMTKKWSSYDDAIEFCFEEKTVLESETKVDFLSSILFLVHGYSERRENKYYIDLIKYY